MVDILNYLIEMNPKTRKEVLTLLDESILLNREVLKLIDGDIKINIDKIIEKLKVIDSLDAKIYNYDIGFWQKRQWQKFHKTNLNSLKTFLFIKNQL